MTDDEKRIQKARALRYKKPIAAHMNLQYIQDEVWEMESTIRDVQWFCDDESLVNALDGDEEEAFEFKMAFADLAAELEQFMDDMQDAFIPDCFDDLFPACGADQFGGYFGYDSYDRDYFGLEPYEYQFAEQEAEKRICRMTKKELLEAVGACLKVYASYLALRYRYDCLESSLDILREHNMERLKLIKAIEAQYDKAAEHFDYQYHQDVVDFDRLLYNVPQEYWIQ